MLRDRLEIEPLSEASRRRIRDAVFARLDRGDADTEPSALAESHGDNRSHGDNPAIRRNRRRWLAVAATAAVAAAALVYLWQRPDPDILAPIAPVPPVDGDRQFAVGEEAGHVPSRVVTEAASSKIHLGDTDLIVAAHSALVIEPNRQRGTLLVLERGSVRCTVPPQRNQPPLRIHAGRVRIEVVGTEFAVYREGDGARVEVERGAVKVLFRGREITVGSGESWVPQRRAVGGDRDGTSEPSPASSRSQRRQRADRSGHSERNAPGAHAPSAQTGTPAADSRKPATPGAAAKRTGPGRLSARAGNANPQAQPHPNPAPPPKPTARERYETAARLEATDPTRALAIYGQLAAAGGPWAPTALFAQAQLALELGRRESAAQLLRSYLRRYPAGPNAEVAQRLLERLR